LIWSKNNKVGSLNANKMPLRNHESIMVFGRPEYRSEATYNPQKTPGGRPRRQEKRGSQNSVYQVKASIINESDGTMYPCSVLPFSHDRRSPESALHPTQKPLALMEWLIKTYTNEGDLVIDPFMGSGTTGVACANTGRRFIGIEKEPDYWKAAVKRIEQTNNQQ
jgi:site-specific DNA-methyltransferase (adenine-specific)